MTRNEKKKKWREIHLPFDDILDHGAVVAGVAIHEDPGAGHRHGH
jgi:hypothetical protein